MSGKEEELRPSHAPPTLTPSFSCRRWSRLTGKSISASDARTWRKRSQQRANTAPCHSDVTRECDSPPRLLPVSPRQVDSSLLGGLKPLVPEQMSVLVGRIYGGRASPRERRQQHRRQQLDAVKDAIYLPAVTSRGMPPPPRDRQPADRPARDSKWPGETSEWLGSPIFDPPPGIKLLSTDLPELRARLMRYDAKTSSQHEGVLLFSPMPPPPDVVRLSSPPSTRQMSPGSLTPPQSRRSVSQQNPRHYRKLKSQDGAVVVRSEITREVPGDDFAAVSSTGSLEAEIIGALEAREARNSAHDFEHDRREPIEAGRSRIPARRDSDEHITTPTIDAAATTEPPNEQLHELEAVIVAAQQMRSIVPEPTPKHEKANSEHCPSAEKLWSAVDFDSISCFAVEPSDGVQVSQNEQDDSISADYIAEALPERVEDQLLLERAIEGLSAPDGNEEVNSHDDGECDVHRSISEMAMIDASAACHDSEDAADCPEQADAARMTTEHTSPEEMPLMSPASSPSVFIEAERDSKDRGTVGYGEESSDPRNEATETAIPPVQTTSTIRLMSDASTPTGDLETRKDDGEDREVINEQELCDREVLTARINNKADDHANDAIADNSADEQQPEVLIIEPAIDVDGDGPSVGIAADVTGSDDDEYTDEEDENGDDTAVLAAQASTAVDLTLHQHSDYSPAELKPASEMQDSSHLSSMVEGIALSEAEPIDGAGPAQQVTAADSSSRRPSASTYDADFEDECDFGDDGDDGEDPELDSYNSD
jgi:hypothetical protein